MNPTIYYVRIYIQIGEMAVPMDAFYGEDHSAASDTYNMVQDAATKVVGEVNISHDYGMMTFDAGLVRAVCLMQGQKQVVQ